MAGKGGDISVWEPGDAKAAVLFTLAPGPNAVAVSRDQALMAASYDRSVEIVQLATGQPIKKLARVRAKVTSLEFDPGSRALLMGAADARIYRWRFADDPESQDMKERERNLERYVGPASVVTSVKYHPFGRVFFAGDWHGRMYAILAYDADQYGGEYDRNLFGKRFFSDASPQNRASTQFNQAVEGIKISSDGEFLALTTQKGGLELWRVRGFKRVARADAHTGLVVAFAMSPDARRLATAGRDGQVKLWEVLEERDSEEAPATYTIESLGDMKLMGVRALAFLPNQNLAAVTASGDVKELKLQGIGGE